MTPDDLPALEPLVAGRNVHPSEYARFLALEGAHGLVLEHEGRLLAAVTVLRAFEHGVVGPLLAAPGWESAGVHLVLLAHALEGLQRSGVPFVEAEATPQEAVVLEGLGFRRLRGTLVMERAPAPADAAFRTRAMDEGDLLDVGALDAEAAGYGRKEFLAALRRDYPDGARVTEDAAGVSGYALMRRSRRGFHLGPLVTREPDGEAAEALLRDALARAGARPVVALLPAGGGLAPALARAGFEAVGELVRMRAGRRDEAPAGATEWLVGSRITG